MFPLLSEPGSITCRSARALFAVFLICFLLAIASSGAYGADEPSTPGGAAAELTSEDLQETILHPWLALQTRGGSFDEPGEHKWASRYGGLALAYSMLQYADSSGEDRFFKSAMRTVEWFLTDKGSIREGVFVGMLSASAYNLARVKFGKTAQWRAIRKKWALWLSRRGPTSTRLDNMYRGNKKLVEAVEVLELYRSGVKRGARGSIIANRRAMYQQVRNLLGQRMPEAAAAYRVTGGANQGWPFASSLVVLSDPPQNPPAYHALVAALYLRAYSLLPVKHRTLAMRATALEITRGLVARTAPDGDIAYSGRSQEQSWVLSATLFASWKLARSAKGEERSVLLGFGRRVLDRLKRVHFEGSPSRGIFLIPAARCCEGDQKIPGQDSYFRISAYTGLTSATLGWALRQRPDDWLSGAGRIPTDNLSSFHFPVAAGRFLQYRGSNVFWMLREQGNNEDARYDTAVHVLKVRNKQSWIDSIPPRPYSGGHHRPADPASPCLAIAKAKDGCAYLSLRNGVSRNGGWSFQAVWRDVAGKAWSVGGATVTPTAEGLKLAWTGAPGQVFKIDHFLQRPRCTEKGVRAAALILTVVGQADCRVIAEGYAGGATTELDRVRSVADATDGWLTIEYAARPEPVPTPRRRAIRR